MYQIHICSTVDSIKPINEPSQKRPLAEQLLVSIDGCVVAGQGERANETIKIDHIKYYLVPGAVRATWLLFVDFSFQLNQFNRHLTLFHLELLIPFVACKEGFDFGRFILFCQQKNDFLSVFMVLLFRHHGFPLWSWHRHHQHHAIAGLTVSS